MENFWNLDSSIIEIISQKSDRSEILIQTNSPVFNPLQTFQNSTDFINYSNSNGFWLLNELSLIEFYSPVCDDPILRGEISR